MNMHRPAFIVRLSLLALVAIACLATATAKGLSRGIPDTTAAHAPRVCFPAGKWDAPQGQSPCIRVTRVYEDGSFTFSVSNKGGTVRYVGGIGAQDR